MKKLVLEKKMIPKHLLKYFVLKERKTILREGYVSHLCNIFDEVKRVLKPTGTVWVNLGDSFVNNKQSVLVKSLAQIPSRFAIEMSNRGWILRNEIIWHKNNCMPSSVSDRFTVDFEKLFFFVKNKKYFFEQQFEPYSNNSNKNEIYNGKAKKDYKNAKAQNPSDTKRRILESMKNGVGKNKRCVWNINPKPYPESHFAVFPRELIETPIKTGCPKDGVVLDLFCGSGTTMEEAINQKKNSVGIELNPQYCGLIKKRLKKHINQTNLFGEKTIFEFEVL